MSKRAIDAAMKAYPPTYTTVKRHAKRVQSELVDTHKPVRAIFQQGYEQAEKDTIERAVMWLEKHADEYNGSESAFDHMEEEMITDFRKAMEEENG